MITSLVLLNKFWNTSTIDSAASTFCRGSILIMLKFCITLLSTYNTSHFTSFSIKMQHIGQTIQNAMNLHNQLTVFFFFNRGKTEARCYRYIDQLQEFAVVDCSKGEADNASIPVLQVGHQYCFFCSLSSFFYGFYISILRELNPTRAWKLHGTEME